MNAAPSPFDRPVRWYSSPVRFVVRLIAWPVERMMSRRGLMLAFFCAAAGLSVLGWIRPPLSRDIAGVRLPLVGDTGGLTADDLFQRRSFSSEQFLSRTMRGPTAQEFIDGQQPILIDSVGALLLVLIALGAAAALLRPRWFGAIAGLLLSASIGANAATVLNHPRLIYLLDHELEQRAQIAQVYAPADNDPSTNSLNDRISGKPALSALKGLLTGIPIAVPVATLSSVYPYFPAIEEEPGGWSRGLLYLLYGPHLVVLAVVGLLLGGRGRLRRRICYAAIFVLLGCALGVPVCSPRLQAEWHWDQAKSMEARCDYERARTELASCCAACPAFADRKQTCLLEGKLDDAEGKPTQARQFFLAFQVGRAKPRPTGKSALEDVSAWPLSATHKPRDVRWAIATMEDVLREKKISPEAAASQTAALWRQVGSGYYVQEPVFGETEFDYFTRDRMLTAALDAWRRSSDLSPPNRDTRLGEGLILAQMDRDRPDRAREVFEQMLRGLADRPLRADVMSTLGDCYMEAGRFQESLPFYMRSCDAYTLPKIVDHRGLKGLGGW